MPERNDPLITVEAVPDGVDREPGWALARLAAQEPAPAPAPGRCRHRVRWRNLKGSSKIQFALIAPLVIGSMLVGLFGLCCSVTLVIVGVADADTLSLVLAPVIAAVSLQLLFGCYACQRTWDKLHQPGLAVCVLSAVVSVAILVLTGMLSTTFEMPWLMLFVPAPLVPMLVLLYFRSALYPLATCVEYPWLPPKILAMRRPTP